MSEFLSTMTDAGRELVARIRDARTAEDFKAVLEKYKEVFLPDLAGGPAPTDADQFAIACALGEFSPAPPRQRASHWEAAALIAIRAKAHPEALFALEKAEEYAHSKERQRWLGLLQEILVARGDMPAPARGPAPNKPKAPKSMQAART